MPNEANQAGLSWLAFALMTVASWGVYGVLLHMGQLNMGDPVNGRYKAFLFVGIAYFLTAVLAPIVVLMVNGASWNMPMAGMAWSLVAGIAGAIGAFAVLLAFGAKGQPAVVMAIVFAGAPVVNAIVAMATAPPEGGVGAIKPQFWLGILLAATGGLLVTLYRPAPGKPHGPPPGAAHAAVEKTEQGAPR